MLCAYLSQLACLHDVLASRVAVIIDERDQVALNDEEDDSDKQTPGEVLIEHVNVTKSVYFLCHKIQTMINHTMHLVGPSPNSRQLSRRRRSSKQLNSVFNM